MSALIFMVWLIIIAVWLVCDGWFSLSVHWKRDGQTFWKDQIIRIVRIVAGLWLLYLAIYFGYYVL